MEDRDAGGPTLIALLVAAGICLAVFWMPIINFAIGYFYGNH